MSTSTQRLLSHLTKSVGFVERRQFSRLEVSVGVTYKVVGNEKKEATVSDISAGGCLLLVKEDIPINSRLTLALFLDNPKESPLLMTGSVVRLTRHTEETYEFGVKVDPMGQIHYNRLVKFCFEKMYEKTGLANWPTARTTSL